MRKARAMLKVGDLVWLGSITVLRLGTVGVQIAIIVQEELLVRTEVGPLSSAMILVSQILPRVHDKMV